MKLVLVPLTAIALGVLTFYCLANAQPLAFVLLVVVILGDIPIRVYRVYGFGPRAIACGALCFVPPLVGAIWKAPLPTAILVALCTLGMGALEAPFVKGDTPPERSSLQTRS